MLHKQEGDFGCLFDLLAYVDNALSVTVMIGGSVTARFLAQLLESGIGAQRVPDWIEF
jgi:hypothetical protein